jgi:hypothetical protein
MSFVEYGVENGRGVASAMSVVSNRSPLIARKPARVEPLEQRVDRIRLLQRGRPDRISMSVTKVVTWLQRRADRKATIDGEAAEMIARLGPEEAYQKARATARQVARGSLSTASVMRTSTQC